MDKSTQFFENCVYTCEQVAEIIHRHPKTVRDMCRRGSLVARLDRGGYLITGWSLRAYLENRSVIQNSDLSSKFP